MVIHFGSSHFSEYLKFSGWTLAQRGPSAGPGVGAIAQKVVWPWKCSRSIQSCGVKTYFLPLPLFSYDLGLVTSPLWALLPPLGVEISMPPAWRAVMRSGCEDLAWIQHKTRLLCSVVISPQKSFRIVEAYSKPLLLQRKSRAHSDTPALEHRHKWKLVLQKHNVQKPYGSPQKSKHSEKLFSNISKEEDFPLEGGNRRQKMLPWPAPKQKTLASINSSCKS